MEGNMADLEISTPEHALIKHEGLGNKLRFSELYIRISIQDLAVLSGIIGVNAREGVRGERAVRERD